MGTDSERQNLLRGVLSKYKCRFAVLDLGAGDGCVADWIEQEFPNAGVFTFDRAGPSVMKKDMTPHLLEQLARREYFSVVLALNFLPHLWASDWRRAVTAVACMGRNVLIQLPPIGDYRATGACIMPEMHAAVELEGGVKIGEAWYESFQHRRPVWLITNNESRSIEAHRPWTVTADESSVTKTRLEFTRPWIPGMNLWNMIGLGASRGWAAQLVTQFPLPEREHGDIYPWNFVYDGERLHLIDPHYEPGGHWALPDKDGMVNTVRMILEEPNNDWEESTG